jgi:hypothetical protein
MYCRNCSNEVSPQAIACPKCGVPPLKGKNYCNACGTQTHPDAVICVHCGVGLQIPVSKPMMNVNIDKRSLVSKWSKYSYSNYVLILLISLMPFVNFKCQNEKVYKLTGLNLAVGKERTYTETKNYGYYGTHDWKRKETMFSADICLFYILTLACLVLLLSSYRKKFKYTRNITMVSLVILIEWFVFTSIRISNINTGMIDVSFGAGYWLTLIVNILTLVFLTYCMKMIKELELIYQPTSALEPMPQPIPQSEVNVMGNEPIISQLASETVQHDESLKYPESSNKNKYIIGGLIGVIVILGILFLFQREKIAVVSAATTTENSVIKEPEQQSVNKMHEQPAPSSNENTTTKNTTANNNSSINDPYSISAYLVYDDGTTSDLNLIDNNQVSLWNTIIGEGSAGKPSHKTKIEIEGKAPDIKLIVYQNKVKVFEKNFILYGTKTFAIDDTGCQSLDIQLIENGNVVLTKTINYKCGE